jgi:cellulose synthase/poly-beta-1,6-N-acetylglucosamine synthase-like glycosyltransferase
MDKRKKVSVVIVTYNAEKTLQACLDSIYQQAIKPIEIIVIDGESKDSTLKILEENHSRITFWKSESDNGIYDAMNKALPYITTGRVIFLGADDRLLPDFSRMLQTLNDPNVIYYANVLYKGKPQSGLISPYYQAKSGIFHQSIIYPVSVFKKYRYNVKYKVAADYALNMQLFNDVDYTFEYKDYLIADYSDSGISGLMKDEAFEQDKSKMILRNFGLKVWARYLFRLLKSKLKSDKK